MVERGVVGRVSRLKVRLWPAVVAQGHDLRFPQAARSGLLAALRNPHVENARQWSCHPGREEAEGTLLRRVPLKRWRAEAKG